VTERRELLKLRSSRIRAGATPAELNEAIARATAAVQALGGNHPVNRPMAATSAACAAWVNHLALRSYRGHRYMTDKAVRDETVRGAGSPRRRTRSRRDMRAALIALDKQRLEKARRNPGSFCSPLQQCGAISSAAKPSS